MSTTEPVAPIEPVDRFADLNGRRLHYLDWGQPTAPPLLLLHGGSAHAHWWDRFAPAAATRFRVLALDLRGHGDSDWVKPAAYAVEDYVADVVAFIEMLALRPLHLIGHSLGGTIAASVAAQCPARMAALIIVDSRIIYDEDRHPSGAGARFMRRLAHLPHPRYRTPDEGIRDYRLLPTGSTARPELLAQVAAHALRPTDDGHWTFKFDRAALAEIRPQDIAPALKRLACPILIVRGGASPVMPVASVAMLQQTIPHLEVAEIAAAHHHVMLDHPEQFAEVVNAFLARVAA